MTRRRRRSCTHPHPHDRRPILITSSSSILLFLFILLNRSSSSSSFVIPSYSYYYSSSSFSDISKFRRRSNNNIHNNRPITPSSRTRGSNTELMGIKGFRAWFETQFPEAISDFDFNNNNNNKSNNDKYNKGSVHNVSFNVFETNTHILVDVNQLLHVALRKARNEDHALTLVLKELDYTLLQMLVSTDDKKRQHKCRSIVLALDGPPCAAKLVTQRRRRWQILNKSASKYNRYRRLQKRGIIYQTKKKKRSMSRESKKGKETLGEDSTICITPGTEFMERAYMALQYWAWQRLSNLNSPISRCYIYISSSDVPGEGEVKLLDWVYRMSGYKSKEEGFKKRRIPRIQRGDNLVFMGGDADLILEGLILPISITPNVFVVLPVDFNRRSTRIKKKKNSIRGPKSLGSIINLWTTTISILKHLPFSSSSTLLEDVMHIRTDFVILLFMNGNDYLPKIRGSSGFSKLYNAYIKTLNDWFSNYGNDEKDRKQKKPFFVYFDSEKMNLAFNLPFCIQFFRMLELKAPNNLLQQTFVNSNNKSNVSSGDDNALDAITPLSVLYTYTDGGFLPQIEFQVLSSSNEDEYSDSSREKLQLRFVPVEESKLYNAFDRDLLYEIDYQSGKSSIQYSKQRLAEMALDDLLGDDWKDDHLASRSIDDYDDTAMLNDDMPSFFGPAQCDVKAYLQGILWNVQTYQDGVCSNYGYDYGRRVAPTAADIANFMQWFLESGQELDVNDVRATSNNNRNKIRYSSSSEAKYLGRKDLKYGETFVKPLNAGLSCLAAIPSKCSDLVPYPYRLLATSNDEAFQQNLMNDCAIDEIYRSCISSEGELNLSRFRSICNSEIQKRKKTFVEKKVQTRTDDDSASNEWRKNLDNFSDVHILDDTDSSSSERYDSDDTNSLSTNSIDYLSQKTLVNYWIMYGSEWASGKDKNQSNDNTPPEPYCEAVSKLRYNKRLFSKRMNASLKPKLYAANAKVQLSAMPEDYVKDIEHKLITALRSYDESVLKRRNDQLAISSINNNGSLTNNGRKSSHDKEKQIIFLDQKHSLVKIQMLENSSDFVPPMNTQTNVLPAAILHELVQVQKFPQPRWDVRSCNGYVNGNRNNSIVDAGSNGVYDYDPSEQQKLKCEIMSLTVGPVDGSNSWSRTYETIRSEKVSKKVVRHQLAYEALNDFMDKDWALKKTKEMKAREIIFENSNH